MQFMEKGVWGSSPRQFLNDYMQTRAFLDYLEILSDTYTKERSYFFLKLRGTTKEKNYNLLN